MADSAKTNRSETYRSEIMFVCKFPDVAGKERELVIREGKVGLWRGDKICESPKQNTFYEVLLNSKLNSEVLEVARKTKE